jgi:Dolichyl-phosphate-mannose-protein mannosyltransferase
LRVILGAIVVLSAMQIAFGLTPLILYDSQIYQLSGPVQFLRAGGLVNIPWNVLTNGPMGLQLTLGMSWVADPTGATFKLLLTVFGCLLPLMASKIAGELGLRSALLAALFVAAYPEFWVHQTLGVIDLPVAVFLLAGVLWLREALTQKSWSWALQAGIAFGLVLASRYQGAALIGLALLVVVVDELLRDPKHIARSLWECAMVVVVAAVTVAPWLIRNYLNFGNPVYPLLQDWLGGKEWSAAQNARFQIDIMGVPWSDLSTLQKVMSPVMALLMTPNNGLFGVVLLLGTLLAMCTNYRRLRALAFIGIGGLVIWGMMHPMPGVELLRYNSAGLVLMLSCTGAILGSDRMREWKGLGIGLFLAAGSLVMALTALQSILPVWQTLTDSNARALFWRANVPSWEAFEFANAKLDASHDKILLIGESRGLWLEIPFIAPTAFSGPQLDQVFAPNVSSEEWTHRLHDLRITHLLISFPEWERFQKGYNYFKPSNEFNLWLRTLPLLFDDKRGTILLAVS